MSSVDPLQVLKRWKVYIGDYSSGWLTDWTYRIPIDIESDDIDVALSNFPILIYLSPSSGITNSDLTHIFSELGSNSKKIAVTTSDGVTQCYVEIERWDASNQKAWLWVKIPSISSSQDTRLYLYYDKYREDNTTYVGNTNSAPAENVWDSNFVFVSHMRDDPDTSNIRDSTSNDNDGAKKGANEPQEADGQIDKCQEYDANDDYIDCGDVDTLNITGPITIEFWLKAPLTSENIKIQEKHVNAPNWEGYSVMSWQSGHATAGKMGFWSDNIGVWVASNDVILTDEWVHCVVTGEGSAGKFFIDSSPSGTFTYAAPSDSSGEECYIGASKGASPLPINGKLDEFRISKVARSPSWVKATYETGRDDLLIFSTRENFTGWTSYPYISINFDKIHPKPEPDTFTVVLNGKQSLGFFSPVSIRKDEVQRFYGYIENIDYEMSEGGVNTVITGRCRKVILWKKWTERFSDTRLSGFLGKIYPEELVKFILRCPVSDVPEEEHLWELDYPRQKIGWGINPRQWSMSCNPDPPAEGTDQNSCKLRVKGFYWRNRGNPTTISSYDVGGIQGGNSWGEFGAVGHNCIVRPDDDDATYIWTGNVGQMSWWYHFTNLPANADTINTCKLHVRAKRIGGFWFAYGIQVLLWDNERGEARTVGYIVGNNTAYQDFTIDVTNVIDTPAKFDATRVAFISSAIPFIGAMIRITTAYMTVDYGSGGSQEVGDWFKVNLGKEYDRVTGIIIQCRHAANAYARYYKVEIGDDGENYIQKASSPTGGNLAQDIIHSWTPIDGIQFVKITITQEYSDAPWEITQIHVYQADDDDYTITKSTISPNISLIESNIKSKSASPYLIEYPLNLPFQRLDEAMEIIRMAAFDSNYYTWEFWIDEATGEIHFGERSGSTQSDKIFKANFHLSGASKGRSITKSVQRLRVIGRGEGRRQDECSSAWKEDTTAMEEVGTFYEELISEKQISHLDTANAWAEMYLKMKKSIIDEIEATIERDPYPSGSWDVGDDVTLFDNRVDITEQTYRLKKLHISVDGQSGEIINVTVTNSWEDITDRIADLYKKIRKLEFSGTVVEDWIAEGSEQGKISQEKIENVWEMRKNYEESNDFQEVDDLATDDTYGNSGVGANGQDIIVSKDELYVTGATSTPNGSAVVKIWTKLQMTDWDKDPRFTVKFIIREPMSENDTLYIQMMDEEGAVDDRFGFRVIYDGSTYTLEAMLDDNAGSTFLKSVATITTDVMYELEAKVDWDDRLVFYYVDGHPRAVLELDTGVAIGNNDISVMSVILTTSDPFPASSSEIEFFLWESQAKKELRRKTERKW